ncbi:MAG: hypothetical protein Q9214_007051 [Letrouitia sp. 1 TL-2023]
MNPETWSKNYRLKMRNSVASDTRSQKCFDKSPAISPEQHSEKSTVTGRSNERDDNVDPESQLPEDTVGLEEYKEYKDMPPNISLNIHGGSNSIKLWNYAIIATILQIAVLIWSGYLAYSSFAHKYKLLTGLKPTVGFPLQAAGTVLLTLGLVLCAGIIDNGSCERHWSREGESQLGTLTKDLSSKEKEFNCRDMQLYWVQKEHTVGDNNVDPYILYAEEHKDQVFESHYSHRPEEKSQNDRDDKSSYRKLLLLPLKKFLGYFRCHQTEFAVLFGVLGFVAQFQGLRFSNWTCSIAQLIALGVATFLRAWVRRSMTKTPAAVPANKDYILDYLTLAIVANGSSGSEFPTKEAFRSPRLSFAFGVAPAPELRAIEAEKKLSLAQKALNLRVRLGHITKWTGPKSQEAIILSNSIEAAFQRMYRGSGKYTVVLQINTCQTMLYAPPTSRPGFQQQVESYVPPASMPSSQEEVELKITCEGGKWKVDDAELEALLSLVSYSAWAADQDNKKNKGGSPAHTDYEEGSRTERQISLGNDRIGWLLESKAIVRFTLVDT